MKQSPFRTESLLLIFNTFSTFFLSLGRGKVNITIQFCDVNAPLPPPLQRYVFLLKCMSTTEPYFRSRASVLSAHDIVVKVFESTVQQNLF